MTQYCRYCNNFVTGNGSYCELYEKEMSDESAKRTNKCKGFEFNPMDAFAENLNGYQPRKPKRKDGEQIKMQFEGVT